MTVPWTESPLAGIDLETTSPDPMTARIVTAALVFPDAALDRGWLLDPGVSIPAEATAVHHITTERARAEGVDYALGYAELRAELERVWALGYVVVAFNASYDFTVLDRQGQRLGYPPLVHGPIADPFVMDRELDRYRPGKRTLSALCEHYGAVLGSAHDAGNDAKAAVALVEILAARYVVDLGTLTPTELTAVQTGWHHDRQEDFAAWLRRKGRDAGDIDGQWPIRTA
ncbi:exonuclease domain-containing protein [Nocardia sp. NPDC055321]